MDFQTKNARESTDAEASHTAQGAKAYALKALQFAERVWDKFERSDRFDAADVIPHIGYATPEGVIIRGRVVSYRKPKSPKRPGATSNFRSMLRYFMTDELAEIEVRCGARTTRTDEEGYFELLIPSMEAGWHEVTVELPEKGLRAVVPAMVPEPGSDLAVISDIDDTIMKTDAWSLRKNLINTFTGTSESRLVFEDAIRFYRNLAKQGASFFYVSSSPWNLHEFLFNVFRRTAIPRGPMFLRDFGIGENQLITGTHGNHKLDAIKSILRANPKMTFVLIGDTGQHDPDIYAQIVKEHAERIKCVILRHAGAPSSDIDETIYEIFREHGPVVSIIKNYDEVDAQCVKNVRDPVTVESLN